MDENRTLFIKTYREKFECTMAEASQAVDAGWPFNEKAWPEGSGLSIVHHPKKSLRDEIAIAAMISLIDRGRSALIDVPKQAYMFADDMLRERKGSTNV